MLGYIDSYTMGHRYDVEITELDETLVRQEISPGAFVKTRPIKLGTKRQKVGLAELHILAGAGEVSWANGRIIPLLCCLNIA